VIASRSEILRNKTLRVYHRQLSLILLAWNLYFT